MCLSIRVLQVDVALSQDKQLVVMHVRELEQLLGNKYRPGLQVSIPSPHSMYTCCACPRFVAHVLPGCISTP